MCESCGCQANGSQAKVVEVRQRLLAANDLQASLNRQHIEKLGAIAINLISSPGSGKTTLLEHTIEALADEYRIGVIEGDIETERDTDRIRAKGIPVVQLTTGGACHLDAHIVHKGLRALEAQVDGRGLDLLFIENVGNLVCPVAFSLGEHERAVLLSVPEGSDKPAKYPQAFVSSQVFLITKTDLLPHFDFSIEEALKEATLLNPNLRHFGLSTVTGEGMEEWLNFLRELHERHPAGIQKRSG